MTRQAERFVILFNGRSGSSHLVSCLNSQPDVLCLPEVLANTAIRESLRIFEKFSSDGPEAVLNMQPFHAQQRRTNIASFFPTQPPEEKTAATKFGLKIQARDILGKRQLVQAIRDSGCKVIYLTRLDRFGAMISFFRAMRLKARYNTYQARSDAHIVEQISINPLEFLEFYVRRKADDARLAKLARGLGKTVDLLEIDYARLNEAPDEAFADIFGFLQVNKPLAVKSAFVKNTSSLEEAVVNLAQLQHIAAGVDSLYSEIVNASRSARSSR